MVSSLCGTHFTPPLENAPREYIDARLDCRKLALGIRSSRNHQKIYQFEKGK
ncbi:MAG: hypothetical protein QXS27_04095 [Candidatus Jordarchaeaceae archaeon]